MNCPAPSEEHIKYLPANIVSLIDHCRGLLPAQYVFDIIQVGVHFTTDAGALSGGGGTGDFSQVDKAGGP